MMNERQVLARLRDALQNAELTRQELEAEESRRYRLMLGAQARYERAADASKVAADIAVQLREALLESAGL